MGAEGINRRKGGSAALAETAEIPLDRVAGTPVPIDGETVIVGKLGINQIAAIAREVLKASLRMTPEERQNLMALGGQMSDIATLLMVLDAETVSRLFSIVLDRPDEWCGGHIGALEALEVADAVLESNKWEQIQATFLRLKRRFPRSLTNSAPPSPVSPASASPSATSETTPSNGSNE